MHGAPLTGKRVRLRNIFAADYEYLYALTTNEQVTWRWRYRGETPSPERFVEQLWRNMRAQFVVEHIESQQRIGHVMAFDADDRNGFCHLGMVIDPNLYKTGWAFESMALFINYLFTTWNFRKLYAVIPEFGFDDMASLLQHAFTEEGRLRDHEWFDGRYWDSVILAMYRDQGWENYGRKILHRVLGIADEPAEEAS